MKESIIQSKIIKVLEKNAAYVIKTIACSRNGVPDIIACWHGLFIAIEVKTIIGRVSKLQRVNLAKIEQAGGISVVARDVHTINQLFIDLNR